MGSARGAGVWGLTGWGEGEKETEMGMWARERCRHARREEQGDRDREAQRDGGLRKTETHSKSQRSDGEKSARNPGRGLEN